MFIERLLNQGNTGAVEASIRFAAARHRLLAENIANVDTPNYVQKDVSEEKFQQLLSERLDVQKGSEDGDVSFDDLSAKIENPSSGILFHDRNNRSMEQLMSDSARNALFHNMMLEILRKQFSQIEMAAKGQPG
jgi:flagellar basal-body rod protein FlgB